MERQAAEQAALLVRPCAGVPTSGAWLLFAQSRRICLPAGVAAAQPVAGSCINAAHNRVCFLRTGGLVAVRLEQEKSELRQPVLEG